MKLKTAVIVLITLSLQACGYYIARTPSSSRTQEPPRSSRSAERAEPPRSSRSEETPRVTNKIPDIPPVQPSKSQSSYWEYSGDRGPERWSQLDSDFATCKFGKQQSPIDIRYPELAALKPIEFSYTASVGQVINNGHTIQVDLSSGSLIRVGKIEYKLIQFHFHTPSEEKINGNSFPLVAHLVHKSDDGKLAVVAVLFMEGNEHPALAPIFRSLPDKQSDPMTKDLKVNPAELLPDARGYYAYKGSLTTPPCSEDVLWLVLKQPSEISGAQLAAFRKLYPLNARPIQPTNGRRIFETF